jgi:serine/threonine-protein kinase
MNCPHCSTPITADARFCPSCGKETVATQTAMTLPPGVAPVRDLVGREIAGRYRILEKLGEGGMGAVYRGEQISLKRIVAVKLLRPEMSANASLLRRFDAEAAAVAKLAHPNTVHIYDFGQDVDGSAFIAMEYIEGRSLRSVVHAEAPFAPARALRIASQVASSIADAHARGIVHRDLKPDNVMLQTRGREQDIVRVLDFGIAKLRDDSRQTQQAMTQAGDMLGTPQYMAPEQIKGEPVDGRADIYALGCMIYEMLTARQPFEAATVMALLSKHLLEPVVPPSVRRPELAITPELDRLVLTATMKTAAARPQTMELYGEHIAQALATLPPVLRATGPGAPASVERAAMAAATPTPAGMQVALAGGKPPSVAPAASPPPTASVTEHVRRDPRAPDPGSRAGGLVWLLGLAAVVIGGIALMAWRSSRPTADDTAAGSAQLGATSSAGSDATLSSTNNPWDKPSVSDNPWDKPTLPTNEMPVPKGLRLAVPAGFVQQPDPTRLIYIDVQHGVTVGCGPMAGGTNAPAEQWQIWEKATASRLTGTFKILSNGAQRDAANFTTAINGVTFDQVIVLYIAGSYRVGVLVQAPSKMFADPQFKAWVEGFYASAITLP